MRSAGEEDNYYNAAFSITNENFSFSLSLSLSSLTTMMMIITRAILKKAHVVGIKIEMSFERV